MSFPSDCLIFSSWVALLLWIFGVWPINNVRFFFGANFGILRPIVLPPSLDKGLSIDVFLLLTFFFVALILIAWDLLFLTLTCLDLSINSCVDLNNSSTSSKRWIDFVTFKIFFTGIRERVDFMIKFSLTKVFFVALSCKKTAVDAQHVPISWFFSSSLFLENQSSDAKIHWSYNRRNHWCLFSKDLRPAEKFFVYINDRDFCSFVRRFRFGLFIFL